jgi:hypothetical protein
MSAFAISGAEVAGGLAGSSGRAAVSKREIKRRMHATAMRGALERSVSARRRKRSGSEAADVGGGEGEGSAGGREVPAAERS